jgi:exodeoxyribonuclease V beta subunit
MTEQKMMPIHFPLWGSRLIEASAGTGKTWTIAALYLRLVLGHGGAGEAFGRALMPNDILVMTFTRAATRELSDRIRSRLLAAARCFRDEEPVPADDEFLQTLLADHPAGAVRKHAAWRLATAAEAMDEASVHTIDAWCQRMLREHAFDSGNLFDEELVADEQALITQAVQDVWRRACYPLPADTLRQVVAIWPDTDAMAADVRQLWQNGLPAEGGGGGVSPPTPATTLEGIIHDWAQGAAALLADRQAQVAAMADWLLPQLQHHRGHWHGGKLKTETAVQWLADLAVWAAQAQPLALPKLSGAGLTRMGATGLAEALTQKAPSGLAIPPAFAWFEAVVGWFQGNPLAPALRQFAAQQVAQRLVQLKRQAGCFGFADMLNRLDAALRGPQGAALRQRILAQYPVALIDEFQDTSPLQYRLFDQIYQTQANAPGQALLLIGDPKQSIYGFRGADIHSYLQARRATEGRHYALDRNHRSTLALVEAVNHCFLQAESSQPAAAFLFRKDSYNPLPFVRVGAKGREEVLRNAHGSVPALTLVHDLALNNATTVRQQFAERCAEHIASSLNDASLGFVSDPKGFVRLCPKDIAVLVRTGKEAQAVRRALQRRGVASVYLSDKDSVFQSAEAADLVHWLRGVAHPQEAAWVRAALAVPTLGLTLDELAHLAHDDEALDTRSQQLRELHRVWQTQGVLAMLRQTLHTFALAARWLAQPDGERRLTNFLHLAELVQTASSDLEGEQALIRWLLKQVQAQTDQDGEQVLRLESDADLVKIVTVHKSKGLEYPVVYLPFATSFREVNRKYLKSASLPDEAGQRQLVLTLDDDHVALAELERLREDLRLLYVALTRPRHALWLGFAALNVGNSTACQSHRSAMGHLLSPQATTAEGWLPVLEQLAAGCQHLVLQAAPDRAACTLLQRGQQTPPLQDGPAYTARFDREWAIASYSRLTRDLKAAAQVPALSPLHTLRPADDEWPPAAETTEPPAAPAPAPAPAEHVAESIWHRFHRGPQSGNFLHDQLEWLAREGFAHAYLPEQANRLRLRCERAGHAEQAPELVAWLQALVQTPLPLCEPGGELVAVSLADLPTAQAEMEFWLPTQALSTAVMDRLCRHHFLSGIDRPTLQTSVLHGMLMGFADLVFEHGGRYWVLDYKSNHLGADDSAYHPTALHAAMAQHRYDVQAAVYLLALHRLLQSRLGERYDPAQHLGGAVYWFVRGFNSPGHGVCLLQPSPGWLDPLDAMLAPLDAANPEPATSHQAGDAA